MKIKSINKNIKKYGYSNELEYSNDNFHGHQIGVAIGVINTETGEICQNYLSEALGDDDTRKALLEEILEDNTILKIEEDITQLEDNNLVKKTIYYLPYYVVDHSVLKPTLNFDNMSFASNVINHVEVELLFVDDEYNRYVTVQFDTRNMCIFELVYDLFDECYEIPDVKSSEEGYSLDFYNKAGHKEDLLFESLDDLKDCLISIRLIGCTVEIEKDE